MTLECPSPRERQNGNPTLNNDANFGLRFFDAAEEAWIRHPG
jgi:hypothetical protein